MAELDSQLARGGGAPRMRTELRGEKLGLVCSDWDRRSTRGGRVLLVIVCVTASSILVVSLPSLMTGLFGWFLDLLLYAAG